MPQRALFVSNKYPFPTDDGKRAVLAGFLEYLVERLDGDNVCYAVVGRHDGAPRPPCRLVHVDPPGRATQVANLCRGFFGGGDTSIQEMLTFSPAAARRLAALVAEFRPDLLLLDTLRVGQYFWAGALPGCRRVLYMDDLFHLRFQRLAALSADLDINPAGTFGGFLPGFVRGLLQNPGLRNALYRAETARIERRELASPRHFERCLLINPNEARLLSERCPDGSIATVKPLLLGLEATGPRRYDGRPVFLMFGSLRHPVYRASVIHFLETCGAAVRKQLPDVRIEIIGEGADEELRRLCARVGNHILLRGFVPDIATAFAEASALVVPLLAAGGLKLKIITALSHGLPVLATDHAADGIPMVAGVDFVRENDLVRYPQHMERLCDRTVNGVLSMRSAQLFRQHFSREAVFRQYDELFAEVPAAM